MIKQPTIVAMSNVLAVFTANVDKLRNTECNQKQKIACFQHIADCILSPALASNSNYVRHCSTATNVLLLFCEDLDSVVRMSAEENLCKIFRCLEKTRVSRVLMDLLSEIKRNGNQKSLRISLNMFAYYSPQIRERNVNWFALKLLPCLQSIAKRKETALQETLCEFVKSFGKNLQIGLTDRETCKILEIFLDNLHTDCVVKRRCSAQNCITLIEYSRNKTHMANFVLSKSFELLLLDNQPNRILGILGLFRSLLPLTIRGFPNHYHDDDDDGETKSTNCQQRRPLYGSRQNACPGKEPPPPQPPPQPIHIRNDCKQIIEIYDFCLHLLGSSPTSNHSLINASLEVLNSILQTINDTIHKGNESQSRSGSGSHHHQNKMNSIPRILKEVFGNQQLKHNEYLQQRKSLKNQIFQLQKEPPTVPPSSAPPTPARGLRSQTSTNVAPSHIKMMRKHSNSNTNNPKEQAGCVGDDAEAGRDDVTSASGMQGISNVFDAKSLTSKQKQQHLDTKQHLAYDEVSMETPSSTAISSPWHTMGIDSMAGGSSSIITNDSFNLNDDTIAYHDDQEPLRAGREKLEEEQKQKEYRKRSSGRSISECLAEDSDDADDEYDDALGGDDVVALVEVHSGMSITNINVDANLPTNIVHIDDDDEDDADGDEEERHGFTTLSSEINEPQKSFALTTKVDVDNLIDAIGNHTSESTAKPTSGIISMNLNMNKDTSLGYQPSNSRNSDLIENISENLLTIDSMSPLTTTSSTSTFVSGKTTLTDDKSQQLSDLDNESFNSIDFESEITIGTHLHHHQLHHDGTPTHIQNQAQCQSNVDIKNIEPIAGKGDKTNDGPATKTTSHSQDTIGSFFNNLISHSSAATESVSKLFKSSPTVKSTPSKSSDAISNISSTPAIDTVSLSSGVSNLIEVFITERPPSNVSSSDGVKDETFSQTHSVTPSTALMADVSNRNNSLDKTSNEDFDISGARDEEATIFRVPNVNPFHKEVPHLLRSDEYSPEKLAPMIGTVYEQSMMVYTARLIAVRFLLNGKSGGLIPDGEIRVSIKNIALNVMSQCIRIVPGILQIGLCMTSGEREHLELIHQEKEKQNQDDIREAVKVKSKNLKKISETGERIDQSQGKVSTFPEQPLVPDESLLLEIKDDHFGKSTCDYLLESPLSYSADAFMLHHQLNAINKTNNFNIKPNEEKLSKSEIINSHSRKGNFYDFQVTQATEDLPPTALPPRPPKRMKSLRKQDSQKSLKNCHIDASHSSATPSVPMTPKRVISEIAATKQQMVDILLYYNHSDPILRGGVQQIIGNFLQASGAGLLLPLKINLQHLLAILIKGLQDDIHTVVIQALNAFDKIFPHVLSKYMTIQACHYPEQTSKSKSIPEKEKSFENKQKKFQMEEEEEQQQKESTNMKSKTKESASSYNLNNINSKAKTRTTSSISTRSPTINTTTANSEMMGFYSHICSMQKSSKHASTCPRTIFYDNDEVIVALLDAFNGSTYMSTNTNNKTHFKDSNDPRVSRTTSIKSNTTSPTSKMASYKSLLPPTVSHQHQKEMSLQQPGADEDEETETLVETESGEDVGNEGFGDDREQEQEHEDEDEVLLISPKLLLNKLRLCHYNKYWLVQNKYAEVISNLNYVNLHCYYQQRNFYSANPTNPTNNHNQKSGWKCRTNSNTKTPSKGSSSSSSTTESYKHPTHIIDDDNDADDNDIVSTYQNHFLNELVEQLGEEDIRVREHATECIVRFIISNAKQQAHLKKFESNKLYSNVDKNICNPLVEGVGSNATRSCQAEDGFPTGISQNEFESESIVETHQTNLNLLWDFFDYRLFNGMSVPLRNLCKIDSAITPTLAEILSPGSTVTTCNINTSSSSPSSSSNTTSLSLSSASSSSSSQTLFDTSTSTSGGINNIPYPLPRQLAEEEKLLSKVLYRIANKLMILNDKNIQIGIIYSVKVLLKYFNFFDFKRVWTEFNFLEICQKFSTINTATALDLNCQIDLIEIITQITTGSIISAENGFVYEGYLEKLFLHNMKILNIYYRLLKTEKTSTTGKPQKGSLSVNEKEYLGYFGNENLYLTLYNILKNSFSSYKITISPGSGSLLISLLKTCLHSLSLCLEMSKWSVSTNNSNSSSSSKVGNNIPVNAYGPSNNVFKLIEEVLNYLSKLIIYAPIECIACLRQLLKYLFAQNYGNQLRKLHHHPTFNQQEQNRLRTANLASFIESYFVTKCCVAQNISHVDDKRTPNYSQQTINPNTRTMMTKPISARTTTTSTGISNTSIMKTMMMMTNTNTKTNTNKAKMLSSQNLNRISGGKKDEEHANGQNKSVETKYGNYGDALGSTMSSSLSCASEINMQQHLKHQVGELFLSGLNLNAFKSENEDECAKHIKIFEPLVVYCLTLFMKSNGTVQASILELLNQLLDLNVTYSNLDLKNVIFDQIMNNLDLIENGIARNGHVIIPPIIKFLIQLTHKSDRKLITIPKIISITNNLLANNGIKHCSILALKALAYEIFFIEQPSSHPDTTTSSINVPSLASSSTTLASSISISGGGPGMQTSERRGIFQSSGGSLPISQGYNADIQHVNANSEALLANCRELETQKEVVLGMLDKFIDSNECQRVLGLLLLRERCLQQFQVDDLEIVGMANQEDKRFPINAPTINHTTITSTTTTTSSTTSASASTGFNNRSRNNDQSNTIKGIKSPLRMQLQDPDVVFSIVCRCLSEGRLYINDWNDFCGINSFFRNNGKHVLADSKQFLSLLQLFIEKDVGSFSDLSYATIILANVILRTEEIYLVNHIKLYLKNNPMAEQELLDEEDKKKDHSKAGKRKGNKEWDFYDDDEDENEDADDDKPSTSWAAAKAASQPEAMRATGPPTKSSRSTINEINFFAKVLYFKLEACLISLGSNRAKPQWRQQLDVDEQDDHYDDNHYPENEEEYQNCLYLKLVVRFVRALNHVCCHSRHKDALQSAFRLVLAESEFLDKYYNFLMKRSIEVAPTATITTTGATSTLLPSSSSLGRVAVAGTTSSSNREQLDIVEDFQVEVFKFLSAMKLVEPLVFLLQQIETVGIKWVVQRTLLSQVCLSNAICSNWQLQQVGYLFDERILNLVIMDHGAFICNLCEGKAEFCSLFQNALLKHVKILSKQTICTLLHSIPRISNANKDIKFTGKFLLILGKINQDRASDRPLQIQLKRLIRRLVSASMAAGYEHQAIYDCFIRNVDEMEAIWSKDYDTQDLLVMIDWMKPLLLPDTNTKEESLKENPTLSRLGGGSSAGSGSMESRIIDEKWLFTQLIKFSTQPDYSPHYLIKILLEIQSENKLHTIFKTASFAVERILKHAIATSLEAMMATFRYNCVQHNPHIHYMQPNPLAKVCCSILMSRIEATVATIATKPTNDEENETMVPSCPRGSKCTNKSKQDLYLVEAVIALITSINQIELTALVYVEAKLIDKFIGEQILRPDYVVTLLHLMEWCCNNIIVALSNTSLAFTFNESNKTFESIDAKEESIKATASGVEATAPSDSDNSAIDPLNKKNICLLLRCINILLQQKYIWSALNQTENHNIISSTTTTSTTTTTTSNNGKNVNTSTGSGSGSGSGSTSVAEDGNTNVFHFKDSTNLLCLILDVLILVTRKSIQNTIFYKSYASQFDSIAALADNKENAGISMEKRAFNYGFCSHGNERFLFSSFDSSVPHKDTSNDDDDDSGDSIQQGTKASVSLSASSIGGTVKASQSPILKDDDALADDDFSLAKILKAYKPKATFIAKLIEMKVDIDIASHRSSDENENSLSMSYIKGVSSSKSLGNLIKNFNNTSSSSSSTSAAGLIHSSTHSDLNEMDDLNHDYEQMKLVQSIGIALLRSNLFYAYAVTPFEIIEKEHRLRNVATGTPYHSPTKNPKRLSSQLMSGKLPTLSVESLSDNEILKKFIKRLSIFGFTTRQQFEEYFMTFLLLINRVYDENMVDQQEQFQIKNVCLEAILELLITYKTFPIVGNKLSHFHHTPRYNRLKCDNISLKKLHQVQMLISEENVFYQPNLERDFSKDNVIGTNTFGCNQYNLDFIWQQMENYAKPLHLSGIEDLSTSSSKSKYTSSTTSVENAWRNFTYFTLESGIDFKSSSQLVFDVLLQMLEQNHVMVLPNLVKFCEICESREQIKQIKEKVFKLQEMLPMDDTISHQHLIYLMCKTEAMLIPTQSELEHLCALIDTYLRSSHVFIRNATLTGLLCLLECCFRTNTTIGKLNEELTLIRNLIVRYINAHGIIDESPLEYSDTHTILVWTLNYALIEWTSKFVPRCELLTNSVVAANKLLRRTTNEKVFLCVIHGLERIIVINSCGKAKTTVSATTSIGISGNNDGSDSSGIVTPILQNNIKKLALDLIKSENEKFSIPALKLLLTCMYIGSSQQLENTELSNGIVQDDPEIIAKQIDKVDMLLHCIKSSTREAAWIYGYVLCQIIRDLVPPNEILTKVIKEFLAINQPYCDVLAMIVHQVFRSAIDSSFLPKLQDWLIYSLPTFLQLKQEKSIWSLCVIFLSASINLHLIKLFPVVLSTRVFRKLGQNEISLFVTAAHDFYGKLSSHQKIVFRDAFKKFPNNGIYAKLLQTL